MAEMKNRPHVVIVGGGFAGLDAARALASAALDVTVIDRHNHHVFQPLLYQVATAALSPGDIASPIRWILRRQQNARVLLATVTAIEAANHVVVLDDGERIAFDYLILAPGATHSYFGHDDWAAHAPGLKTLDDALVDAPADAPRVRRSRARNRRHAEGASPDICVDRRRSHRRRARRGDGRDRASLLSPRVRHHRSRSGTHHPDRSRSDDSARVSRDAA